MDDVFNYLRSQEIPIVRNPKKSIPAATLELRLRGFFAAEVRGAGLTIEEQNEYVDSQIHSHILEMEKSYKMSIQQGVLHGIGFMTEEEMGITFGPPQPTLFEGTYFCGRNQRVLKNT